MAKKSFFVCEIEAQGVSNDYFFFSFMFYCNKIKKYLLSRVFFCSQLDIIAITVCHEVLEVMNQKNIQMSGTKKKVKREEINKKKLQS